MDVPTCPQLQDLLESLTQESVSVEPALPGDVAACALAVYADVDARPRAAWSIPLPLGAWVSSRLLGLPASSLGSLGDGSSSAMLDAFQEVCNILGTLANGPLQPRLRLHSVLFPGSMPEDITLALASPHQSCGFAVFPAGLQSWQASFLVFGA